MRSEIFTLISWILITFVEAGPIPGTPILPTAVPDFLTAPAAVITQPPLGRSPQGDAVVGVSAGETVKVSNGAASASVQVASFTIPDFAHGQGGLGLSSGGVPNVVSTAAAVAVATTVAGISTAVIPPPVGVVATSTAVVASAIPPSVNSGSVNIGSSGLTEIASSLSNGACLPRLVASSNGNGFIVIPSQSNTVSNSIFSQIRLEFSEENIQAPLSFVDEQSASVGQLFQIVTDTSFANVISMEGLLNQNDQICIRGGQFVACQNTEVPAQFLIQCQDCNTVGVARQCQLQARIGRVVDPRGQPIGSNSCMQFSGTGQGAGLTHCQSFGSEVSQLFDIEQVDSTRLILGGQVF